jgi:hypothetical protein
MEYDIVTAIDENGTLFAFTNRDKSKIVPVFMISVAEKQAKAIPHTYVSVRIFQVSCSYIAGGLRDRTRREQLTAEDVVTFFPGITEAKKTLTFHSQQNCEDLQFLNGAGECTVTLADGNSIEIVYDTGIVSVLMDTFERDWVSHQFAFAELQNKITGIVAAFISGQPSPKPVFQFVWGKTRDAITRKITSITLSLRTTANRDTKSPVLSVELGGNNSMFMRVFCNSQQMLIDRLTDANKSSAIGPVLAQVYSLDGSLAFIQGPGRMSAPGMRNRVFESDGMTVLANIVRDLWAIPSTGPVAIPP